MRRRSRVQSWLALLACGVVLYLFVTFARCGGDGWDRVRYARRLRQSLRQNNIDNVDVNSDRFLTGGAVRETDTINASMFYAAISDSTPLVIRHPPPCTAHKWTIPYIREVAGDDVVHVETSKNNRFYANEGLEKAPMKLSEFLDIFTSPDRHQDYYLAEESIEELPALAEDLIDPEFTNFARIDKRQIWVGGGGQVSPLHHDQWDNVLFQLEGERLVTLYDPLDAPYLYPKDGDHRHFSAVDPEHPDPLRHPLFAKAQRYDVKLRKGEALVIPAFWWHQIRHRPSIHLAVNFWLIPSSILAEVAYDVLLPP